MRSWIALPCLLVALALAAASFAVSTTAAAAPDPAALARRVARWQVAMDSLHVPGLAVVVVTPDTTVLLGTWGWRDVERRLPVTPDTRFYFASCTKPFTATAVCEEARRGGLDLDAPLVRTLPRFALADSAAAAAITLRDLLCHRPALESQALTFGEAYTGQMTEDRFYRVLATLRPGEGPEYSNLHFTLAGRALAAATGTTWGQAIEARVLEPAGLAHTGTRARDLAGADAALPYVWTDGRWSVATMRKTDRNMHAAGGMVTTPRDLARWLRLQLGDGRLDGRQLLDAEVLRSMRVVTAPDADEHPLVTVQKRVGYGLGWDVREHRGERLLAHNGRFDGAAAFMGFMPSRGAGVGVLANTSGAALWLVEAIGGEVMDLVLGHEPEDYAGRVLAMAAGARPAAAPDTGAGRLTLALAGYAGRYANDTWGTLDVTVRGGSIDGRIGDLPLPFALTGPDRVLADATYPGEFVPGPGGKPRGLFLRMARGDSAWFARR